MNFSLMIRRLPIFLLLVLFLSCKKSNTKTLIHNGPDVYLTGYSAYSLNGLNYIGAVYWKNDVLVPLPEGQFSTGISFSNNDIYVSGNAGFATSTGESTEAVYWKNALLNKLGNAPSYSSAITISGSDIYIAGYAEVNGIYAAVYWKNAVLVPLANTFSSGANAIAVSGTDVYVAGKAGNNGTQAVYWKNGVQISLEDSLASCANAIFLSGNDVYIAGFVVFDGSHPMAVYWKNGLRVSLNDTSVRPGIDNTYASGIAVSGSDVYVIGYFDSVNPVYWKNGTINNLSFGGFENATHNQNGIVILGTDIYISSNVSSYLKNDSIIKVGNGYATNIAVK